MNPLVYIAGTPHGGTSAVAAVVDALGVYLGAHVSRSKPETWHSYECPTARTMNDVGPSFPTLEDTRRWDAYVAARVEESFGKIPVGVKCFAHHRALLSVKPLRVIRVRRPLVQSIRKATARLAYYPPGEQSIAARIDVAQRQARLYTLAELLADKYESITVGFNDLKRNPWRIAKALAAFLDLEPSEADLDRAADRVLQFRHAPLAPSVEP